MKPFTTATIILILSLLSVAGVVAQSSDARIYMPLIQQSEAVIAQEEPAPTPVPNNTLTIRGTIHSTDDEMTSAFVELWKYHPQISGQHTYIGEVAWESSGAHSFDYQFNDIPRLTLGHLYYVVYNNRAREEGFLEKWYSANIRNPLAGSTIEIAMIDAAGIELDSPKDGETESIPQIFEWDERNTESDQYIVQLYKRDPDGNIALSVQSDPFPHPTEGIEVTAINHPQFHPGVEYRWRILVTDGADAFGVSLDSHRITFNNLSSVSASSFEFTSGILSPWQSTAGLNMSHPAWQTIARR